MQKKKLILIEDNTEFGSIYSLNFVIYLGMPVSYYPTPDQAIIDISADPNAVGLIVCRSKISGKLCAKIMHKYITKKELNIPVIALGEMGDTCGDTTIISSGLGLKSIIKTSAQKMGISAMDMVKLDVPDYFPIDTEYFEKLDYTPVNIYKQNLQGDYELTGLHESYDLGLIEKLKNKKVKSLYVQKNDRVRFTEVLTETMVANLDFKKLNSDEKLDHAEQSMHLLSNKILKLGLTENNVDITKNALKNTVALAKKSKGLKALLKQLLNNKHSYSFLHTQLLTFYGIQIIQKIDWGTPEIEKAFSFASLFHDITIQDDKLSKIHSKEQLTNANLTPQEKSAVEKHAQIASQLVLKFPSAPPNTEVIIRQHHGMLNGVGFSPHCSGSLTVISSTFMVLEYFLELLLENEDYLKNPKMALQLVSERFSTSRFRKIIEIIDQISTT
ncbi:MAG: hypothetical protein ACPGJV_00265 [Bacteriovoracaceae bacterium]